jgi:hypothetical protein
MYLGSGVPGPVSPIAAALARVSPGKWSGTMKAPSVAGAYHFTVGLFDRAGKRTVVDFDGWNVTIGAAAPASTPTSGASTALPADIPLAPPFSYGNPVPATFNAEGRTVNGFEVASNKRPDVGVAAVADFYSARLPRSGWTLDPSTVPGPSATSFTIAATQGSRVCVVDYGGGTVQIFYSS